jgi:hypothetical protein
VGIRFNIDERLEQLKYFVYLHQSESVTTREKWLFALLICLLTVAAFDTLLKPQLHKLDLLTWLELQNDQDELIVLESISDENETSLVVAMKREFDNLELREWTRSEGWTIEADSGDPRLTSTRIVADRTLQITKGLSRGEVKVVSSNVESKHFDCVETETGLDRNAVVFVSIRNSRE